MSAAAFRLREAALDDAYPLWIWANDRETRAGSHGRDEISWQSHVDWLTTQLASANAMILMAEDEDRPVGSIRFQTDDEWASARLSYVIAPEARGRGLSRLLVREGCARMRERHPAASIFADVMEENVRSSKVFAGEGWRDEPVRPGQHRFWTP